MAHLKKRVTFAGVDYILVPVELWEALKDWTAGPAAEGWAGAVDALKECRAYEGEDMTEREDYDE